MHSAPRHQERPRLALIALLVAAGAFYSLFIERTSFRAQGQPFFTLLDDAMISMRYAQHLAEGHGLVWNIGEAPVEGFTNPGWVLVLALIHRLSIAQNYISLAVMIISALILLVHVTVVYRLCGQVLPQVAWAPLLASAVTAFYFPLVFWSLRGMEVGFLALLMELAALAALRPGRETPKAAIGLGLLLSAAIAVRLDAFIQVVVILTYVAAFKGSNSRWRWIPACMVLITVLAILGLQLAYFGDMLPNTYYQKVAGGAISERLLHGVLVFLKYALPDVAIMAIVVAAGLLRFPALRSNKVLLFVALFAVQCAYSIWVGGDYAEPETASANRFITQGVPALIVLFAIAVDRFLGSPQSDKRRWAPPWIAAFGIVALTILLISGAPWYRWVGDNSPLLRSDIRRARAGLAIARFTSPEATIAVHAAGQIPYYSGRRAIDLLGLNDPVIARGPRRTAFYPGHDKWDYEYSIGQLQPDLIADNWIRLADYMSSQTEYRKLDNGMYMRVGTTLVDPAGLQGAFP